MEGADVEVFLDLVDRRHYKSDVENHKYAEAHRNGHSITHKVKGMAHGKDEQRVHTIEERAKTSSAEMRHVDANG